MRSIHRGIPNEDRPILNPQIFEERLESVYGQMADIRLQLSKHTFGEIGCISRADDDDDDDFNDLWVTKYRPLTLNMNELVHLGDFPPHLLPQGPLQDFVLILLSACQHAHGTSGLADQ